MSVDLLIHRNDLEPARLQLPEERESAKKGGPILREEALAKRTRRLLRRATKP